MSVKHMLLACVFAPLAIGEARAQEWNATSSTSTSTSALRAPAVPPASGSKAAAAATATDGKGPELNALRYYAHGRDLNRVAA